MGGAGADRATLVRDQVVGQTVRSHDVAPVVECFDGDGAIDGYPEQFVIPPALLLLTGLQLSRRVLGERRQVLHMAMTHRADHEATGEQGFAVDEEPERKRAQNDPGGRLAARRAPAPPPHPFAASSGARLFAPSAGVGRRDSRPGIPTSLMERATSSGGSMACPVTCV